MEKMSKISFIMLAFMLAIPGIAGAVSCDNPITICGCVADQPNTVYTLSANMNCGTQHGIIIGAAGVTIDCDCHIINGGGVAGRDCQCANYNGSGCDDMPCRDEVDSGIFNAADPDGVGAGVCTTGFDGVTIKNCEITGWCDAIFMSGTCAVPGSGVDGDWLVDIEIEDNCIHDNGQNCVDCFNDGIFIANAGRVDTVVPGFHADWCAGDYNEIVIKGNVIWNQRGSACEECPGGSGINYNGGIEDPVIPDGDDWDIHFAGCGTIDDNVVKDCNFAGIMITHATRYNKVTRNVCKENGFAGIGVPCDYSDGSIYEHNVTSHNQGPGIGVNCGGTFKNNISYDNVDVPNPGPNVGFEYHGYGIWASCGKDYDVPNAWYAKYFDNVCCQNVYFDIGYAGGSHGHLSGDRNTCYITDPGYSDGTPYNGVGPGIGGCSYRCGPPNYCTADINRDGNVDFDDLNTMKQQWNRTDCEIVPPWVPCCPPN